jgi:hypothetical protein
MVESCVSEDLNPEEVQVERRELLKGMLYVAQLFIFFFFSATNFQPTRVSG